MQKFSMKEILKRKEKKEKKTLEGRFNIPPFKVQKLQKLPEH